MTPPLGAPLWTCSVPSWVAELPAPVTEGDELRDALAVALTEAHGAIAALALDPPASLVVESEQAEYPRLAHARRHEARFLAPPVETDVERDSIGFRIFALRELEDFREDIEAWRVRAHAPDCDVVSALADAGWFIEQYHGIAAAVTEGCSP